MIQLKNIAVLIIAFNTLVAAAKVNSKIVAHRIAGYQLSVYIPEAYTSSKKYKVVYVNDGQWLFKRPGSLQLDSTLDSLSSIHAIDPIIVVGVHSDRSRTETYVPYALEGNPYFESKATTYADVLTKKIIPFIENTYSTIQNRNGRAIFGFSFGGLNATWLTIHYSKYFSFSAGFSPSFWVNNYQLIQEVQQSKSDTTFWIDIGTNEWNYYVPFINKALQKGGVYGKSIFYYEVPNGEHTIRDWKKRISFPILIYAGKKKSDINDWHIEVEVIKSTSRPGVFYQRINPIVTLSNGVKFSLANQAKYVLKNKSDGQLADDGRFIFNTTNNLKVNVSYGELNKEILIKYQDIQRLKTQ